MTIDLGFAHLDLPSGRRVGMVDVPGHSRFLHNMLAGVHGMDAVVLVVAADEGVMPQTREHLDILDLLGVEHLLVALTKVDLVDPAMVEMARADVLAELSRRGIGAEVVAVSPPTGQGLEEVIAGVTRLVGLAPPVDRGRPRLPVDRSFTMAGFGSVVTGSLVDGGLRQGQEVELLPGPGGRPRRARIRGLQQHGRKVDQAQAGSRVAANLQGLDAADVRRGQVLAPPGTLRQTDRLDLRLRVLAGAPPLRHNDRVVLHAGTDEVVARAVLLEAEMLAPGASGFVQLRLARPVAVRDGDRAVIRRPSPAETLGGGVVLDAAPPARRRADRGTVAALTRRMETGGRVLEEVRKAREGIEPAALASLLGMAAGEVEERLAALVAAGEVVPTGDAAGAAPRVGRLYAIERWMALEAIAVAAVEAFHRANPLRAGTPREALGAKLAMRGRALADAVDAMTARGALVRAGAGIRPAGAAGVPAATGDPAAAGAPAATGIPEVPTGPALVALPGFVPTPTAAERAAVEAVLAALAVTPLSPPPVPELARRGLTDALRQHLEETGQVVRVAPDLVLLPEAVGEARRRLAEALAGGATITVAAARDLLGTSRRTAVPLLEYFDATHLTIRDGDLRRRRGGG
jgi:selenocysteine-specific elongation factor